jgi:hypothetical protein
MFEQKLIIGIGLAIVLATTVNVTVATDYVWTDNHPSLHYWRTSSNWWNSTEGSPSSTKPGSADDVFVYDNSRSGLQPSYGPYIDSATSAVCNSLWFMDSPGLTTTMDGGTLTVSNDFHYAYDSASNHVFNVSGGIITVVDDMTVGQSSGTGTLNLSDTGLLKVDGSFSMHNSTNATIDIADTAMLLVDGNVVSDFINVGGTGYIDLNMITGGLGLTAEYFSSGDYLGYTGVFVPDPSTISLLAFGGLALLRRRR